MKALTIQQPWASAIMAGVKRVENRTWATKHRGSLVIHAGRTIDPEGIEIIGILAPELVEAVPTGVVLGVVELVDCVRFEPPSRRLPGLRFPDEYDLFTHELATGPVCWILRNPRPLDDPIPLRGLPGLFDVDLDAITG